MSTAQQILVVYGVVIIAYEFVLGVPLAAARHWVIACAGGELSEPAWTVAALSIVLGVGSAIGSLLLRPRRTESVSRI